MVLVENINTEIDLYNNQIFNFEFVDYYPWKELTHTSYYRWSLLRQWYAPFWP